MNLKSVIAKLSLNLRFKPSSLEKAAERTGRVARPAGKSSQSPVHVTEPSEQSSPLRSKKPESWSLRGNWLIIQCLSFLFCKMGLTLPHLPPRAAEQGKDSEYK